MHVCIDEGACSCVLVCIYMWKTEVDLIEPGSSGLPVSLQAPLVLFPQSWACKHGLPYLGFYVVHFRS